MTQGMNITLLNHMGDDIMVANTARVSFAKEVTVFGEADKKIIKYLATHGHWSPFAHAQVQFRIKAPIFVARQLAKHQVGFSWNEESRRYIESEPEFYWPKHWRGRAKDKKQGSGAAMDMDVHMLTVLEATQNQTMINYNTLLDQGVAPEQARIILPVNMLTEWIWTGSLYGWARVCKERLAPDAQFETQLVAQEISASCRELFPVSWKELLFNVSSTSR